MEMITRLAKHKYLDSKIATSLEQSVDMLLD